LISLPGWVGLFRFIGWMMRTTRRKFLGLSGSLLATGPKPLCAIARGIVSVPAVANTEAPWREPGQFKDAEYLRTGKLRYDAVGREIVGHNRTCFNNRPLYCEANTECVVLTGDRPFLRLLGEPYVLGSFSAALLRGNSGRWFYEYSDVESRYRCGKMTWHLRDADLPNLELVMSAVPLQSAGVVAIRLQAQGLKPGDKLVWAFGGASYQENARLQWDPVMRGNPRLFRTGGPRKPEASMGMEAAQCRGNRAIVDRQEFRLLAAEGATRMAAGKCDRAGLLHLADASSYSNPVRFAESTAGALPMICGVFDLAPGADELFWAIEAPMAESSPSWSYGTAAAAFATGAEYLKTIERITIETPEPSLDAAVASVCHAIDAACKRNPFIFRHGCMAFSIEFLGWRVMSGATALGWHERIQGTLAHWAPFQVRDSLGHQQPEPDPTHEYCIQGSQSRFWGLGRLAPNNTHEYNTQSQFFDQAIRDWRWTGDPAMEEMLRPMLELHLQWAKDCFDPDNDGLYESYINTLPTDSVWYNGGGSVEESAYVYFAHRAAGDMARRAGDHAIAGRHSEQAERIRHALSETLWLEERGHFGRCLEQGGRHRVHTDAWVYSQFLPIDAGMTTPEQALQALYYTEWWLERTRLPFGGELCQPSNWVPWKWSVRDTFGGDVCALALAYFQTGLADEGWELLIGATLESAYGGAVPGGFSHIGAGTDFADNTHMFARTVVEGLFGFDPDYPNNHVQFRPALPSSWKNAAIKTSDYSLEYMQDGDLDIYKMTLTKSANAECVLSVRARGIKRVTSNGQEIPWTSEPGFGCTRVRIVCRNMGSSRIAIQLSERVAPAAAIHLEVNAGETVRLTIPNGKLIGWHDFHNVLEEAHAEGTAIYGRLARKPGFHIVLADVRLGNLPQYQIFKLHVIDAILTAELDSRRPLLPPKDARWKLLDLAPQHNGDVRTIFQQSYLSPRPKTCSVRLGVDGYSPWTFTFWGEKPPPIGLENLHTLTDSAGRIVTPQNIPFRRFDDSKNIAFTSNWDNWPNSVTVPVSEKAEACWLLVCGSTFPMQTHIANAEVHFRYVDGVVEKLELIPPVNFWSLCPWGGGDYDYVTDGFCLPKQPPLMVQLGQNCRAIVLSWKLRRGVQLKEIALETLSQDVVIGLMGVSLMNPWQYSG